MSIFVSMATVMSTGAIAAHADPGADPNGVVNEALAQAPQYERAGAQLADVQVVDEVIVGTVQLDAENFLNEELADLEGFPDGIRVFEVIPSRKAAHKFTYEFAIDGRPAQFFEQEDGSVLVGWGEESDFVAIGQISAPWAVDANGEPVGSSFKVAANGKRLRLSVDRSKAASYPITATATTTTTVPEPGCLQVVSQASETECDALVALYNATGGPSWHSSTNWLTATDPCTWYGVVCDRTGVSELDFDGNQLTGSIPAEIGNLTNLTYLNLGDNLLTSVPVEIGNLTNLTSLYLGGNQLTSVPTTIGNLTNLTELHLYDNLLTSVPVEIGNLTNLTSLYLYDNLLTSVPATIGNLTNLTELRLHNNSLAGDITSVFEPLRVANNLYELVLHGNGCLNVVGGPSSTLGLWLAGLDPAWNDGCPEPGCLQVVSQASETECDALVALYNATGGPSWQSSTNWLTATDPCTWYRVACGPTGVRELYLWDNRLTGSIPAEIGDLTNLSELHLSDNLLTSLPATIGNLTKLTVLYVEGNLLTSLPVEIGNLTTLLWLHLYGNLLTSLPVEIGNLTNLNWLTLSNNSLAGDITSVFEPLRVHNGNLEVLRLHGNGCLNVVGGPSSTLGLWLAGLDPAWNDGCP